MDVYFWTTCPGSLPHPQDRGHPRLALPRGYPQKETNEEKKKKVECGKKIPRGAGRLSVWDMGNKAQALAITFPYRKRPAVFACGCGCCLAYALSRGVFWRGGGWEGGRKEGRKEGGRKEGGKEARREGRKEGRKEERKEERKERRKEGKKKGRKEARKERKRYVRPTAVAERTTMAERRNEQSQTERQRRNALTHSS